MSLLDGHFLREQPAPKHGNFSLNEGGIFLEQATVLSPVSPAVMSTAIIVSAEWMC